MHWTRSQFFAPFCKKWCRWSLQRVRWDGDVYFLTQFLPAEHLFSLHVNLTKPCLNDAQVLTNDSLSVEEQEQFYKFGVKLANVAFPMMLIFQITALLNLMYTTYKKVAVDEEFFGNPLLYKLLLLVAGIGGIISLVASGKSIYSHGSLTRECKIGIANR